MRRMVSKSAIALKLGFPKPLVSRSLVGKMRLRRTILHHVFRFISGHRGLDVDQRPFAPIQVIDPAYCAVTLAEASVLLRFDAHGVDFNQRPKINAALPDR